MLFACNKISFSHEETNMGLNPRKPDFVLRPSINGLVTDGNTKLCCLGFIFKRLLPCPVCEAEILRVKVKSIEVFSSFKLISDKFRLKVSKIAKKGT